MAINFNQSLQALLGKVGLGNQPAQQPQPAQQAQVKVPAQSFSLQIKPGGQLKGTGDIVYSNGKTWDEMDFMEQWNTAMGVDYKKVLEDAAKASGHAPSQAPPPQFTPPLLPMSHPWITENPKDYGVYKLQGPKAPPPSAKGMQNYFPPTSSPPVK